MVAEILRDRLSGYVGDVHRAEGESVSLNVRLLVEKMRIPWGREDVCARGEQLAVVALHVEDAIHLLAVREGRRVENDEIVGSATASFGVEKGEDIGGLDPMPAAGEAVELEILAGPRAVGVTEVYAHRGGRAAGGRVDGKRTGIAEQIEHADRPAFAELCGDVTTMARVMRWSRKSPVSR